jgi:lipid-A-disaccharide synthase
MKPPCVMIIAGEASGDLHGSRLVQALRQQRPELFCFGIGGPAMAAQGVRIFKDAARLSVVGITEVAGKLPELLSGLRMAKHLLKTLRPDLLVLIDFPDFNLHVAAQAKKLKIPVLYYISPQVWAWRPKRIRTIGRRIDHMAVILPFEAEFYRKHQIPVTFVGHPLMDSPEARVPSTDAAHPVIGLLPGSRDSEIQRLLPVMLEAARIVSRRRPQIRFPVSLAPSVAPAMVTGMLNGYRDLPGLELIPGAVANVLARCSLAVAASGTVTLEAAISGVPMVILYKVSPLSYRLGRALVKVAHIGLVNLIAGRQVVPELIQEAASPQAVARHMEQMISDKSGLLAMRQALAEVKRKLGKPGASQRTADIAWAMMDGQSNAIGARQAGRS